MSMTKSKTTLTKDQLLAHASAKEELTNLLAQHRESAKVLQQNFNDLDLDNHTLSLRLDVLTGDLNTNEKFPSSLLKVTGAAAWIVLAASLSAVQDRRDVLYEASRRLLEKKEWDEDDFVKAKLLLETYQPTCYPLLG
jgi:hypothetical protein